MLQNTAKIDPKVANNRLKNTSRNQSTNSLNNNTLQSRICSQNGVRNEPTSIQIDPRHPQDPPKASPWPKLRSQHPPEVQCWLMLDQCWTCFRTKINQKSDPFSRMSTNKKAIPHQGSKRTTAEQSSKEHDSHIQDRFCLGRRDSRRDYNTI